MANGLYGQAAPAAGILTKLTTTAPAAGKVRSVTVGVCNTSEQDSVSIHIACSTATLAMNVGAVAPYKSANRKLKPGDEYEREIVLSEGEHIWVRSDKAVVSFDARGFEGNA